MNTFVGSLIRTVGAFALALSSMMFMAGTASAQPRLGTDYNDLKTAQPSETAGKIEVIEFFWFSCPHCNTFEPYIEEWKKKLPADVVFKRVHVRFNDSFAPQQRLYLTLETMGLADTMIPRVFKAIHVDKAPLNNEGQIADFMAKQGVDRAKFLETYNSFTVQSKAQRGVRLTETFKVDGVPFLAIGGRYTTSPAQVGGSYVGALQVTDYLINQVRRQSGKK